MHLRKKCERSWRVGGKHFGKAQKVNIYTTCKILLLFLGSSQVNKTVNKKKYLDVEKCILSRKNKSLMMKMQFFRVTFFSEALLPSQYALSFVCTLLCPYMVFFPLRSQLLIWDMSVMGNISHYAHSFSRYAHSFSHYAHNLEHSRESSSLHKYLSTY